MTTDEAAQNTSTDVLAGGPQGRAGILTVGHYPHRVAGHCGSGAMRDLMEWHGLGWGGIPAEGLVFALGGDLGLSYLRSPSFTPPLYLVGRGGEFETDLPHRLGAHVRVAETDDPGDGWASVLSELHAGRPVLAWADIAELPYLRVQFQMSRHDIVIVGYDAESDSAYVVDNDRPDVQEVPMAALAAARSSTGFPQPSRHRIFLIHWPEQLPPLREVAADAFASSARKLRRPPSRGIADHTTFAMSAQGLEAADLLAADIAEWPEVSVAELDALLFTLSAMIEKAGTGGGLFRGLLGRGAAEVAALTDDEATAGLADDAARCARSWTAVARTAVERGVDPRLRAERAAEAARSLPAAEAAMVVALEHAAESLRGRARGGGG